MKIAILVEGKTEIAFKEKLVDFIHTRVSRDKWPSIKLVTKSGRIPTGDKLKREVDNLLKQYDAVIALTDVYTGTDDFADANDAKQKMRAWVGSCQKFYPHAAQHDFEAWLLPYWSQIQHLSGINEKSPGNNPESVNHGNPPAHRLKALFERKASKGGRGSYNKPRDAKAILKDSDLMVAVNVCPELKDFVNTILVLSGTPAIQ